MNNKNKMYFNNETFEVVAYDENKVYLYSERSNDTGELEINSIEVYHIDIQKLFFLNYCSTIHKVQGSTIKDPYTIWDWGHSCMSKKAKYTALSRGTCVDNISIMI